MRADFFVGSGSPWTAVSVGDGSLWATEVCKQRLFVRELLSNSQYAQSVMNFLWARSGLFRLLTLYMDQISIFTHQNIHTTLRSHDEWSYRLKIVLSDMTTQLQHGQYQPDSKVTCVAFHQDAYLVNNHTHACTRLISVPHSPYNISSVGAWE